MKRKKIVDFMRNKDNNGLPYYTAGEMDYLVTGISIADMNALKVVQIAFSRLCNVYKISHHLFNNENDPSLNNINNFIKQMYTNACLPLGYVFRDAFNTQLLNESTDKKRFFDFDVSAISELQDDMKEMADIVSALPGGLTLNEIRVMYKFAELDFPYMNIPIVKDGYKLAEELSLEPAIIPQ